MYNWKYVRLIQHYNNFVYFKYCHLQKKVNFIFKYMLSDSSTYCVSSSRSSHLF